MNNLPTNTTVKLNLIHNISSNRMLEVRFDLTQSVYSVKQSIEKRYGTQADSCELSLQDSQGNHISTMENDKLLGYYSPEDGYWILIQDLNPHSVLKDIEDVSQVEKYKISEEAYDNLPDNFRKFKQKIIQQQQAAAASAAGAAPADAQQQQQATLPPAWDQDYMKEAADKIKVGDRCRVIETNHRGEVKYVGKVAYHGMGYFVGVKLDEPYGNNDGKYMTTQYFECADKYGIFTRPDEIEVGDFPEIDPFAEEDEI